MNSLVEEYRQSNPNDQRSDQELTLIMGDARGGQSLFQSYPDFASQYSQLDRARRMAAAPSLGEEFSRGLARGTHGALGSGAGALSLLSGLAGAPYAEEYYQGLAREQEQAAGRNAPTIQGISDIQGAGDIGRYALGLGGEVIPQLAEAAVASGLGALAGPGLLGGGAIGAAIERRALSNLARAGISAAGDAGQAELRREVLGLAAKVGGGVAGFGNEALQEAGGNYNTLANNPNVAPETARSVSLAAGGFSGLIGAMLPVYVLGRLFPGVGAEPAKKYLQKLAHELATTIPLEGSTEALQELVSIGAEKYADPSQRNVPLTKQQKDRIVNAGMAGIVGGGLVAPFAAIGGVHGGEVPKQEQLPPPPPIAPPAPFEALTPQNASSIFSTISGDNIAQRAAESGAEEALTAAPPEPIAPMVTPSVPLSTPLVTQPVTSVTPEPVVDPFVYHATLRGNADAIRTGGLAPGSWFAKTPEEALAFADRNPNAVIFAVPKAEIQPVPAESSDVFGQEFQKAGVFQRSGQGHIPVAEMVKKGDNYVPEPIQPTAPQLVATIEQNAAKSIKPVEEPPEAPPVVQVQTPLRPTPEVAPVAPEPPVVKESLTAPTVKEPLIVAPKIAHPFNLLETVDWDNTALKAETSRRGTASGVKLTPEEKLNRRLDRENALPGEIPEEISKGDPLMPSFFLLTKEDEQAFSELLGRKLTSLGTKTGTGTKSNTRRIAFFENKETGEVIGKPVWRRSDTTRGGLKFYVKGEQLEDFMAKGNVPVGSVLLKDEVSGTDSANTFRYNDYDDFQKQVINPAAEIMKSTGDYVEKSLAAMQAQAFTPEGKAIELLSPAHFKEADYLQDLHAALVAELSISRDLTPNGVERALLKLAKTGEHEIGLRMAAAFVISKPGVIERLHGLSQDKQLDLLFNETVNLTNENIKNQLGGTPEIGGNIGPSLERIGNLPESIFYSRPEERTGLNRATTAEERARFNRLVSAISDHGFKAEFITALRDVGEFGKTNEATRLVTLALYDAQNPTMANLHIVMEEAAHAMMKNVPDDIRARAGEAMQDYKSEILRLQGLGYTIEQIQRENPNANPQRILNEELLVKSFVARGIAQPVSRSLASQIVRFIKNAYYKLALATQKLFGREPSRELALAYVRNRFDRMDAGDFSLFRFLIPPPNPENAWRTSKFEPVTFWARPNESEGIGERLNPKAILETEIAAWNEQVELENAMEAALKAIPKASTAAKEAGVSVLDWFRGVARLDNPAEEKAKVVAKAISPVTKLPIPLDLNHRVQQFAESASLHRAANAAYTLIQSQHSRIVEQSEKLRVDLEKNQAERTKQADEVKTLALDYTNVEGLTKRMQRGLQKELTKLSKDLVSKGRDAGIIFQQLEQLGIDPGEIVSKYTPAFRKLFTGDQLGSQKLYNFLDKMANDSAIDFGQGVREVKKALRAATLDPNYKGQYDGLLEGTTESNALLAATVGYAKADQHLLIAMELQKLSDSARRTAINIELKNMLGVTKNVIGDIAKLPRSATIEDRAKVALQSAKSQLASMVRNQERMEARREAIQAVEPFYAQKVNELAGPTGIHAPFVFGHGAVLWVPRNKGIYEVTGETNLDAVTDPTLRRAALLKIAEQKLGQGFETPSIHIDARGEITNPAQLDEWIGRMLDYVKAREELAASGAMSLDGTYWQVRAMQREVAANLFRPAILDTDYGITGLRLSAEPDKLTALGSPAARVAGQQVRKWIGMTEMLHPEGQTKGWVVERLRAKAKNIIGGTAERYKRNFYNSAVKFLRSQRDVTEIKGGDFNKWMNTGFDLLRKHWISGGDSVHVNAANNAKFMDALKDHVKAEWGMAQFWDDHLDSGGVGVRDDKLKVKDPQTGAMVTAQRQRTNRGIVTIPQVFSQVFHRAWEALTKANWADFVETVGGLKDLHDNLGPQEVARHLAAAFTGPDIETGKDIQNDFFKAIAIDEATVSPFKAPDGLEANPAYVKDAYNYSKGDPLQFAYALYRLHGGTTDLGQYVQDVMQTFADRFTEMRHLKKEIEPNEVAVANQDISSMVPSFIINPQKVEHLPSLWFDFASFDRQTNHRLSYVVAAEVHLGVHSEKFASSYGTALSEAKEDVDKLRRAESKVLDASETTDTKEIDKALAQELGGENELAKLRKLRERYDAYLDPTKASAIPSLLSVYMRGKNSPTKPMRFAQQLISFFAGWMINQPGSALSQSADGFNPLIQLGVSPTSVRYVLRNFKGAARDFAGGLAHAIGWDWSIQDRIHQRRLANGQRDPAAVMKFTDLFLRTTDTNATKWERAAAFLRHVSELQNLSVGKKGPSNFTALRPFGVFNQIATGFQSIGATNMAHLVEDFVYKGMDYIRNKAPAMGSDLAKLSAAEWAERIGLSKADQQAFKIQATRMLDDWGLDYFQLVKEGLRAEKSGSKDILSDRTLGLLQPMATKETITAGNINTMPGASFNSSVIKAISPLLGWPFRRSQQINRLRYDENGRASLAAVSKGLIGLTALSLGGLAVSALVDLYNEELLKKRRNIRSLDPSQGPGNLTMAFIEHSARVGTFGLFGDFANEALNVGTGEGANRGISLDQRVVFMNSLLGMVRSISNFVNTDFQVDYAGTIRPLAYSLGGNEILQFIQIANGVLGLDNAESRATQRTNVGNWLRVAGRETGLEVKPSGVSGGGTSTPMTPLISRMQLAAIGNDSAGFNQAYREAIAKAKEQGHEDPVGFVKQSFASRNPLRSIFRTTPTEEDYRRILGALPNSGRSDVQEGLASFNRYGAMLGITPFEGKVQKQQANPFSSTRNASPFDLNSVRNQVFGGGARIGF